MLRLVLTRDDGTAVDLDTKDVSLQLTLSAADITQTGKSKAAHSLAFKLPFSDINDEALGFFDLMDASAETRTTRDCDVYDEGNPVLFGKLSVRSCDLQSRTYDCVVYSREAGVWQVLKESRWADVFTYDGQVTTLLDHNHDAQNVTTSNQQYVNDVTDGSVGNNVVWYPYQLPPIRSVNSNDESGYVPFKTFMNAGVGGVAGVDYHNAFRVWAGDFLPSFQIEYLLTQVFAHCGYTLDTSAGAFTGNLQLDKLYMMLPRESLSYRPYFSPRVSAQGFGGDDSGQPDGYYSTGNSINQPDFKYIAFQVIQAGDADPDGFFGDISQLGGFRAPSAGAYFMEIELAWSYDGIPSGAAFGLGVYPYDIYSATYGDYAVQTTFVGTTSTTIQFTYNVTDSNQIWVPLLVFNIPTGATAIQFDPANCHLTMKSYLGDSPKLNVPNSFPDETVDQWLGAIMSQFNLLLTLDVDARTATLHEKKDYYEADVDNAKDWTGKVDRGKSMVVTNNLESLYRRTFFTNADADDGMSEYDKEYNKFYMTHFTYNSGVPLAQPKEEVGGYFAPTRYQRPRQDSGFMTEGPLGIQAYRDRLTNNTCGPALNKKPLLVYKGGYYYSGFAKWPEDLQGVNIYDSYQFNYGTNNLASDVLVQMPQPAPYRGSVSLAWNTKTSYDGHNVNGISGLFDYAYKDEFRKKYSKDARNLELTVHLTSDDIRQFQYSDLVVIDGIYYHVDNISGYVVGSNKPCKVKLYKLLDVSSVDTGTLMCNLFVGNINFSGIVSWTDRDGATVTGTQACCEFYGGGQWEWNAATQVCSTGQSEWEEGWDEAANFLLRSFPNKTLNFEPNSTVQFVESGDTYSQVHRFRLVADTKGNVTSQARNTRGETLFPVTTNSVVSMTLNYVAVVTNEPLKGQMEFGERDATYRVEDFTAVKVDTDGTIIKNGDASSVDLSVSVTYANGVPEWSVDCTGNTGNDMKWSVSVELTLTPIDSQPATFAPLITLQNGDSLAAESGDLIKYE